MDPGTVIELRAQLLSEHKRLSALLERTHKHMHRSEPLSADFAEQSVEVENDVVVETLDREGKVELQQIKRALNRMENGTYGQCTECGTQIQRARLLTIPEAELCIKCARATE